MTNDTHDWATRYSEADALAAAQADSDLLRAALADNERLQQRAERAEAERNEWEKDADEWREMYDEQSVRVWRYRNRALALVRQARKMRHYPPWFKNGIYAAIQRRAEAAEGERDRLARIVNRMNAVGKRNPAALMAELEEHSTTVIHEQHEKIRAFDAAVSAYVRAVNELNAFCGKWGDAPTLEYKRLIMVRDAAFDVLAASELPSAGKVE